MRPRTHPAGGIEVEELCARPLRAGDEAAEAEPHAPVLQVHRERLRVAVGQPRPGISRGLRLRFVEPVPLIGLSFSALGSLDVLQVARLELHHVRLKWKRRLNLFSIHSTLNSKLVRNVVYYD